MNANFVQFPAKLIIHVLKDQKIMNISINIWFGYKIGFDFVHFRMDEFQIRAVGRSENLGWGQTLINGHLIEHLLFLKRALEEGGGLTPVPTALQIAIESLETRFPTYYSSLPSLSRAIGRSENQGESSNLVGIICTRVGIGLSDLQKLRGGEGPTALFSTSLFLSED